MEIIKEASPHLRRKDTTNGMMIDVLIALSPVVIFALIVYQWYAVRNLLLSVGVMDLAEFVFVLIKSDKLPKEGHSFKERFLHSAKQYKLLNFLAPTISGVIFGLLMPATFDQNGYAYFAITMGALFGIVFAKLVFGGTGNNIFNPAAVAMVFAKTCFGSHYRVANYASPFWSDIANAGATFLKGDYMSSSTYNVYSLWDLFIGHTPGLMGETCKIAILIGLVYLLIRRAADWRVVSSFLGTFLVVTFFAGICVHARNSDIGIFQFVGYELLAGGVLFGMTYMITDPVTMPLYKPSRILYGICLACITVLIRLLGRQDYVHEGMVFAILLCNMLTSFFDYYKWGNNRFSKPKLIAMGVVPVLTIGILVWGLLTRTISEDVVSGATDTVYTWLRVTGGVL